MFQFQHIEYLFGLLAIPLLVLLYFFISRWKKRTMRKIGDELLVKQLIKEYSPAKFRLKFILITISVAVVIISLANPRIPAGDTKVNRNGIDVMIALDVSKSMLAQDIKPNRLERAKQFISKLIDKLSNDRIGIIVFAGRAYLQMPLTTDHAAAKLYLSSATPDVVPTQGTVIGDALKMCRAAFSTKEKKYKAIVLISDGEDHEESAVKTTKALAEEGISVNTVGIGSPEGTTIIDAITNEYKKDAAGNPVITKLNETALKDIAANGNGVYQLFSNADEVASNIDTQLKGLGQKQVTDISLLNYRSFFQWLLALSLLLLAAEFFVIETSGSTGKPRGPQMNRPAILVMGSLFFSIQGSAQGENTLIKHGNEAYDQKQYELALSNYQKAMGKNPANDKAAFNSGNALYKSGKPDESVKAYDLSIQNSHSAADKAVAWYNKGVVLQNSKKLPECINAYKNALKLDPSDEDARLNLQKALLQQKQQQQKENKQLQKKEQDKKQDQQKEQKPKPQPSKMSKQEAEEKLKALLQQEKNLQDKLRKVDAASPNRPEKDW